ncbi:MAG: hypothetical protein WB816_00115 [Methylocystis sp.]
MADYYSLLARKIGPLAESTPQGRHAVYELARKALFNQLRAIRPPVAEQVIQTEGRALDEAIARLETEVAGKPSAQIAQAPPPVSSPPEPRNETRSEATPSREQQRPAAPLPAAPETPNRTRRIVGIGAFLVALVAAVALAALHFRERPEDLAKLKPAEGPSAADERGKFPARVGDGDQHADNGPSVPIAQKAQLVVATLQHPDKVEHAYNGGVVWRLENIGGDEGEPLKSAIRGDIDFPEAKTKVTIVIQKNHDAAFSASHTINVSFKFAPGSELKAVKAIDVLRIRRPEAQSGEKMLGVEVPITDNNFLIGLMRGDSEARNLTLLRTPAVIDLPMQLSDGRMATINLEKGASGERVFADAIAAWAR